MGQIETQLKPSQLVAMEQLLGGATITDAAAAAGVGRATLHRWLTHDYEFRGRYNGQRQQQYQRIVRRLIAMSDQAASCVEAALTSGDVKTALAVLRGVGILDGRTPRFGDDSAARLEANARRREQKDALDALLGY